MTDTSVPTARQVQWRRGTAAENDAFTGAVGEVTVDTDHSSLRTHDGATEGGTRTLSVRVVATYAALPINPFGVFVVLADETRGGGPIQYMFLDGSTYWVAMVKVS